MITPIWWKTVRSLPLVFILSLLLAGFAQAVSLVESSPEDGAELAEPPAEVRLEFSSPVEARMSVVSLLDSNGKIIPGTELVAGEFPNVLVLKLPALPGGHKKFFVKINPVISGDGSQENRQISFTLAEPLPVADGAGPSGAGGRAVVWVVLPVALAAAVLVGRALRRKPAE